MLAAVQDLATKNDVGSLMGRIVLLTERLKANVAVGTTTAPQLANVASSMVNSIALPGTFSLYSPTPSTVAGVIVNTSFCGRCGHDERLGATFCSECGSRME